MSKKEKVVVGQSDNITADQMSEFWRLVKGKILDGKVLQYIFDHITEIREKTGLKWWEKVLEKERECHRKFFGKEFDLSAFQAVLEKQGLSVFKSWEKYGLEPHYLPLVLMSQKTDFPGWKIKPGSWYYQQVAKGKILYCQPDGQLTRVEEVALSGITVLIDRRLKPRYNKGRQMFSGDNLCSSIIAKLREERKIAQYDGDQCSRFGVSAEEWQNYIRPGLAETFGFNLSQVRLETAIEANVIPQLYPYMSRHKDGEINTWIWYEEYFGGASGRLCGGGSDYGGLSSVSYDSVGDRWHSQAFRPLVVLEI